MSTPETPKPGLVKFAVGLGLIAPMILVITGFASGDPQLWIGGLLVAILLVWIGDGSTLARNLYAAATVAWVGMGAMAVVNALLQAAEIQPEAWGLVAAAAAAFLLPVVAAILLFTRRSRIWFGIRTVEREAARARRIRERADEAASSAARAERPAPGSRAIEAVADGPPCARCHQLLERNMSLGEGAVVVMGNAPVLYRGVECTGCGRVECSSCKGTPQAAPCRSCGAAVRSVFRRSQ